MKRIALITPMLQPYRITFYEKLSKLDPNLEWLIFYGRKEKEDGKPGFLGDTTFQTRGFRLYKYRIGPYTFRYNKGLFKSIKSFNPDVVILQSISGNISNRAVVDWAKSKNKKVVYWSCGWEPGFAKGIMLKLKYLFAKPFFKKADFHLTYSSTASKYTEDMGIDQSRIRTCYNGIEIDHILANETDIIEKSKIIRSKHSLDNHITFLYVGALVRPKKLSLLMDAFEDIHTRYNNTKLMIIGDGPEKDALLARLGRLNNNNIIYLGRIVDKADEYFAATDCFVLPGIGGLALNQAMLQRKICIVSKADGTEEDLIIDGKTGFRFENDNKQSLFEAMEKRILLSPELGKSMGEAARDLIIDRSNVNHMVDTFSSTINNILTAN